MRSPNSESPELMWGKKPHLFKNKKSFYIFICLFIYLFRKCKQFSRGPHASGKQ